MTKIVKAKFKISRRYGVSLWGSAKDPIHERNYVPGQHGPVMSRKQTDYGRQLKAKQLLKSYYGYVTEKQFRNTFKLARRMKGDTGANLVGLLERRLDAVIYRLNLASSIFAARQMVSHKHVFVNGKKVNIPSYKVSEGDIITISEKAKTNANVMAAVQKMERSVPDYLKFDAKAFQGEFIRVPTPSEVPYPLLMEPSLVVEFYSR